MLINALDINLIKTVILLYSLLYLKVIVVLQEKYGNKGVNYFSRNLILKTVSRAPDDFLLH